MKNGEKVHDSAADDKIVQLYPDAALSLKNKLGKKNKDALTEDYTCSGYCRGCPFPGAKCCEGEKPSR